MSLTLLLTTVFSAELAAPAPTETTYKLYDAIENGWYSIRLGTIATDYGGLAVAVGNDTFIHIDAAGDAVLRTGDRDTNLLCGEKAGCRPELA
jgi:hypothetical protein